MNPLLVEALGSIVRWFLAIGAGFIVQHGIWTAEDSSKYVAAGALAVITLGWSLYQKYGMRLKLLTALTLAPGATEKEVEARVENPTIVNPPVSTPKTETP